LKKDLSAAAYWRCIRPNELALNNFFSSLMEDRPVLFTLMFLTSLLIFTPSSAGMDCSDVPAIAKEAVEYYMSGAPSSDLPLTCAIEKTWKYFNPNNELRSPEPGAVAKYVWFDGKRDKYEITDINKVDDNYNIKVTYTITGVKSQTTYTYIPWDALQKGGACGLVVNDDFNRNPDKMVIRSECKKR
jgi:hypothetical protein